MAISVDYITKVISIPQADLTPVGGAFYDLDLNWFRLQLKDWEDDENGIFMPDTHEHTQPVEIGGVTIARVVRIINGYTITFEDGSYAVNLIGANSNVGDVTNLNSVSIRSANSAGLVQNPELQYSSFEGAVWYDSTSTQVGTIYPAGTRRAPVNNMTDAMQIAQYRGLGTIQLMNSVTLTGADYTNMRFVGENPIDVAVVVDASATVENCKFEYVTLSGTLDDDVQIRDSLITTISNVNGWIENCVLFNAVITLGGGQMTNILRSWSGVPGTGNPVIDMGGSGQALALQGYTGDMTIQNKTGTESIAVDLVSGQIFLDDDVDGTGPILLRGVGMWSNEDTWLGTAPVTNELIQSTDILEMVAAANAAELAATNAETASNTAASNASDAELAAQAAETAALQAVTDIAALEAPDNASILDIYRAHFNRRKWDKDTNVLTLYQDNQIAAYKLFDTNDDLSEITPQ